MFIVKQKTTDDKRMCDLLSDRYSSDQRCNRYKKTIHANLTASDISSITLKEASEKVGVTRQTLMKAIKTGRVSAEKSDNGEWRIEPVELFRVWPPVNG